MAAMGIKQKMPNNRRMLVEIIKSNFWYKKGEVHEVGCYISLAYESKHPCFEKAKGYKGIHIDDCIITRVLPKT